MQGRVRVKTDQFFEIAMVANTFIRKFTQRIILVVFLHKFDGLEIDVQPVIVVDRVVGSL
jgi:hypothetical protein